MKKIFIILTLLSTKAIFGALPADTSPTSEGPQILTPMEAALFHYEISELILLMNREEMREHQTTISNIIFRKKDSGIFFSLAAVPTLVYYDNEIDTIASKAEKTPISDSESLKRMQKEIDILEQKRDKLIPDNKPSIEEIIKKFGKRKRNDSDSRPSKKRKV